MFDHLVLRKSSKIVKSFQMSRQRSALDCIRCDSASTVRALKTRSSIITALSLLLVNGISL